MAIASKVLRDAGCYPGTEVPQHFVLRLAERETRKTETIFGGVAFLRCVCVRVCVKTGFYPYMRILVHPLEV